MPLKEFDIADPDLGITRLDYLNRRADTGLATQRLNKILFSDSIANRIPMHDIRSLGSFRDLMAPSDTSAFPPSVLGLKVGSGPGVSSRGNAGEFYPHNRSTLLSPTKSLHVRSSKTGAVPELAAYETLLHEAAHARGESSFNANIGDILKLVKQGNASISSREELNDFFAGENMAEALADSILNERGF